MAENKKDVRYQSDEGRPELVDGGRSQEAVVGFAGGESLVPQFNKKEVEQIAKGVADESADVTDLQKEIRTKVTFFEVSNITSIDKDILNEVKSGDVIVKKTGNQRHSYRVSYKENGQGICLTYSDASVVETVSYDKSGNDWVYNSTDKTNLFNNPLTTPNDIIVAGANGTPTRLPVGTAGQFLKCGTTGVMWGDVSSGGGTQLYKHYVVLNNANNIRILFLSTSGTAITTMEQLITGINNHTFYLLKNIYNQYNRASSLLCQIYESGYEFYAIAYLDDAGASVSGQPVNINIVEGISITSDTVTEL